MENNRTIITEKVQNILDLLFSLGFKNENDYDINFLGFQAKLDYLEKKSYYLKLENIKIILITRTNNIQIRNDIGSMYYSLDDYVLIRNSLKGLLKTKFRKLAIKKLLEN